MNKRIMMSVLIIGVVASLVGVGVYALYSDTASSSGNTFSTSTLDLKVDGADTMVPMSFSGIAPGDDGSVYHSQFYALTKDGSVPAGKLTLSVDNVHDIAGVDGHGDLSGVVHVGVYYPDADTYVGEYSLSDLASGIVVTNDFDNTTATVGPRGIQLSAELPASAGNEVQGDGVAFDAHLTVEQTITAH